MRNQIKSGSRLILFAFLFFVTYNTYFGWNLVPESDAEKVLDLISTLLFIIAIGIYITPLLRLYERAVVKMEYEIDEEEPVETILNGWVCSKCKKFFPHPVINHRCPYCDASNKDLIKIYRVYDDYQNLNDA